MNSAPTLHEMSCNASAATLRMRISNLEEKLACTSNANEKMAIKSIIATDKISLARTEEALANEA